MDEIVNDYIGDEIETSDDKHEKEVSAIFQWSRSEINKISLHAHGAKKEIIKKTALKLEGKIPIDTIAMEITVQLRGKVSERMVHESLEEKYKQKYRTDNAKKQNKAQDLAAKVPLNDEEMTPKVLLDTQGNTSIEPSTSFSPEHKPDCLNCETLSSRTKELEDALGKATTLSTADDILSKETQFVIFKHDEEMIVDALQKCKISCYLFFNENGTLVSVRPDTCQEDNV